MSDITDITVTIDGEQKTGTLSNDNKFKESNTNILPYQVYKYGDDGAWTRTVPEVQEGGRRRSQKKGGRKSTKCGYGGKKSKKQQKGGKRRSQKQQKGYGGKKQKKQRPGMKPMPKDY